MFLVFPFCCSQLIFFTYSVARNLLIYVNALNLSIWFCFFIIIKFSVYLNYGYLAIVDLNTKSDKYIYFSFLWLDRFDLVNGNRLIL